MTTETLTTETLTTYTLRDSGSTTEIEASDLDDAREQAVEWVIGGDWNAPDVTLHIDVDIIDEDGDVVDSLTVAIDPDEPACTEDEHDWQSPHEVVGALKSNPGVVGSQHGGILVTEVCACCGRYRVTDTGHTRPDNGRRATALRYRECDADSRAWVESLLQTYAVLDAEPGVVGEAEVVAVHRDRRDASEITEVMADLARGRAWVWVEDDVDVGDLVEADAEGCAA